MLRRCAKAQAKHMQQYGEAHQRGESTLAWTDWGVKTHALGVGPHIYPAIKFVSDMPCRIPGVTELVHRGMT